jgi:hypothetical protein
MHGSCFELRLKAITLDGERAVDSFESSEVLDAPRAGAWLRAPSPVLERAEIVRGLLPRFRLRRTFAFVITGAGFEPLVILTTI